MVDYLDDLEYSCKHVHFYTKKGAWHPCKGLSNILRFHLFIAPNIHFIWIQCILVLLYIISLIRLVWKLSMPIETGIMHTILIFEPILAKLLFRAISKINILVAICSIGLGLWIYILNGYTNESWQGNPSSPVYSVFNRVQKHAQNAYL